MGISADDDLRVAQTTFLTMLAETSGVRYTAQWTETPRGAWRGDLTAP